MLAFDCHHLAEPVRDVPAARARRRAVGHPQADKARASDRTRSAYGDQVRSYLRVIVGLLDEPDPAARRRRAVLTLSALCG